MDKALKAMKRRLEKLELEHLRQHALELHERLEQVESELEQTRACADFWQRDAMQMQEALLDTDFATHRSIGLTKSGEVIVVRND